MSSLIDLLTWLADKHGIATAPGSQVTFTSQGSNLWPAGAAVTTTTITGHRAMSATSCPGTNLNQLVATSLTSDVHAQRGGSAPMPPSTAAPSTVSAPSSSSTSTTVDAESATTRVELTTTLADPIPTGFATERVHASVVESSPTTPKVDVISAAANPSAVAVSPGSNPLVWLGAGLGTVATAGLAWRHHRMSP